MSARALEFAALTAARTGEVLGARWSEIDLTAKVWTVPADRTKAGREHRIQLSDPALVLLGEIVRAADSHPANPHPAGEGLRWVAAGFGALGLNDHEILEREFIVYDSLYAECKRRTSQA